MAEVMAEMAEVMAEMAEGNPDKMSQVFGAKIPAGSCPALIFRIPGTIRVHNLEEKEFLLSRIVQR